MKEASYYNKLANNRTKCCLCPHYCLISEGETGICRARINKNGILYADNYGKVVSIAVDPIEKKPLYHFYPGSKILSLGNNTCNLSCDFCQNYTISQLEAETVFIEPEKLAALCQEYHVSSVAFTYSEPLTWFEYVYDCAVILKNQDIKTVLVTNGYINEEPLTKLLPYIDAMNIDLKGMSDEFYRLVTQSTLEPVLKTIRTAFQHTHIELTNLVIPTENDSIEQMRELISFISSISPEIPLHISRYYPQYKRSTPPTPQKTLTLARQEALEILHYVYLGNILTDNEANTYCPNCKSLLISRNRFVVDGKGMDNNRCRKCGTKIYGHFN